MAFRIGFRYPSKAAGLTVLTQVGKPLTIFATGTASPQGGRYVTFTNFRGAAVLIAVLGCSACATPSPLPTGQAAYQIIPAEPAPLPQDYVIGPLDVVDVRVFKEPDLSVEKVQVDAAGRMSLPLLGSVQAAGKSPAMLTAELAQSWRRYLKDPRVNVTLTSITRKIIVEGQVRQAGVYDIRGSATLVEALAMARSTTDLADLDQVFVFRTIDGQVRGARFNMRRIRVGADPDPQILAGDKVVVGMNYLKDAWREVFNAPIYNIFRVIP